MTGFDLFQLNFNRQSSTQGVNVSISGKVKADVADLFAFWRLRRDDICALPMVAGLAADPSVEDISIAVNKRTITGTMRFLDPAKK